MTPSIYTAALFDPEEIAHIVRDRERFDATLYTPLAQAYQELLRRRQDGRLERAVSEFLSGNIPHPLRKEPRAVLPRSIMSPNYEARQFTDLVEEFGKLEPLYWEYAADKFTSNNDLKRMLGKLYFFHGRGRRNGARVESFNIIDFPASDGERLSSMATLWGEDFVRFHHEFFDARFRRLSHTFYDSSRWLEANGKRAESYYRSFLALFIRHGVLFEDVLLNSKELGFTTRIFLPAFLSLQRMFGVKPLIVPIATKTTENDNLWFCYPAADKAYVEEKLKSVA